MAMKHEIEISLVLKDQISKSFQEIKKNVKDNLDVINSSMKNTGKEVSAVFDKMGKDVIEKTGYIGDFAKALGMSGPQLLAFSAGAVGAGVAVFQMGKAISFALDVGTKFEQSLANLRAIANPTAQEMEMLSQQAMFLGESTRFSADEAANAFTVLASQGMDAMQVIASSEAVLNLAAGTMLDMEVAAELVSSSLNQYGLDASEATNITDAMTVGFNVSGLKATDLADAMKYVGVSAKSAGISFSDTINYLSILADAGIKSSVAGTGLSQVMIRLSDKSSEVSKVLKSMGIDAMAPLETKMLALKNAGMGLSEANKFFGETGLKAGLALAENIKKIDEFKKAQDNATGANKRMADIMNDTREGAIKDMESAIDSVGITLFNTFGSENTNLIRDLTDKILALSEVIKRNETTIQAFGEIFNVVMIGASNVVLNLAEIIEGAVKILSASLFYLPSLVGKVFQEALNIGVTAYNAIATKLGKDPIKVEFEFGDKMIGGVYETLAEAEQALSSASYRMLTGLEKGKGTERVDVKGNVGKPKGTDNTLSGGMDLSSEEEKKKAEAEAKRIEAQKKRDEEERQRQIENVRRTNEELKNLQASYDVQLLQTQAQLATDRVSQIELENKAELKAEQNKYEAKKWELVKYFQDTSTLEKVHTNNIARINKEKDKKVKDNEEKLLNERVNAMNNFTSGMGSLIDTIGGKNKKALYASRALATAEVMINSYIGASKAYAQGGLFGAVGAAGIIASGLASVIKINNLKFADGGIVPGSSIYGDRVPAMLNSGEMVLNRTQQSNLFRMANSASSGQNISIGGASIVINGNAEKADIKSALNEANDELVISLARRMRTLSENGVRA